MEKIIENMDIIRKENTNDILKYFDRIHDKLFQLNALFVGVSGILTYYKVEGFPKWLIFLSLYNLVRLILIEYYNMERSRNHANFEAEKAGKLIKSTNIMSLDIIACTSIYIVVFIYHLW